MNERRIVPLMFFDTVAFNHDGSRTIWDPLFSPSVSEIVRDEPLFCYVYEGSDHNDALRLDDNENLRGRAAETMDYQAEVPFTIDLGKGVTCGVYGATVFSASNVLGPNQVRRMQELVGGDSMWVGLPRANTMYAVSTAHGHEGHTRLFGMIDSVFNDRNGNFGHSQMVSYTPWLVQGGRVVGADYDGPEKPKRRLFGRR